MQGLADFLGMGGYAAYVWPAFGFAALVLLGLLGQSWRAARRREEEFDRLRSSVRPPPRVPKPAAPRRAVRPTPPRADAAAATAPTTTRE